MSFAEFAFSITDFLDIYFFIINNKLLQDVDELVKAGINDKIIRLI